MIAQLFALTLAWMTSLVPGKDHAALAWAVASHADSREEAALLTAIAYRESRFDVRALGDHGMSVCAFQLFGADPALVDDPQECTRRAVLMLRASKRVDPSAPVASYARGPRWRSDEAQRISKDRERIAAKLLGGRFHLPSAATSEPSDKAKRDAGPRVEVSP